MIFGNLKSPVKTPESMTMNNNGSFTGKLNEICLMEITSPQKAIEAYHQLLKDETYKRQEEHQKIIFQLCACYERIGDLGRALYYMALCPYYYPGEHEKDYLKTYRSILFHKASEIFREKKNKLQVLVIEPELSRLDFIMSTIEKTCYQNVYAIESRENFRRIQETSFIREYDLILLSSDMYRNFDEMINAYSGLKKLAYSPFVSFMLNNLTICEFRRKHPGIQYYIANNDLMFLYAMLLMMLKRNV